MAALTQDRNTPEREGEIFSYPVKTNVKIFAGALVALDATFAAPGTTALNLVAVGRADEQVDNTGGADGAVNVKVRRGTFRFNNSAAGDLIARGDINANCYIVDDNTVAKTNGAGTRSVAGVIVDVDALGVWVRI
jgi:hypothetical protein